MWSPDFPVLRISDREGFTPQKGYTFVPIAQAAYNIDYYQNYLLLDNLIYYPEGTNGQNNMDEYFIHYSADPNTTTSTRLAIDWAGAAPDRPAGK